MQYTEGNTAELKQKFWHELGESAYVMLQRDADPDSASPMMVQLDETAQGTVWFFAHRSGRYAPGGSATAIFISKGHGLFARIHGMLSEEPSRERLDKHWSKWVEAWFPGGKGDPDLMLLRMDLGDASIWNADLGMVAMAKMALGMDTRDDAKGNRTETSL